MAGVAALGRENGLAFASKSVHRGSNSGRACEFRLKRCLHELFFVLPLLLKLGGDSRTPQIFAMAPDPKECNAMNTAAKVPTLKRRLQGRRSRLRSKNGKPTSNSPRI